MVANSGKEVIPTMTKAEKLFHQIGEQLPNATESKRFGAFCIKATNGKLVAIFWKDHVMFKLNKDDEKKALRFKGARQGTHLYATDRKMKGWVLVPFSHSSKWRDLAKKSIDFVMGTTE